MSTGEQEGFGDDQSFSAEARAKADRANTPIGDAMRLAVRHPSWTAENLGETIYVFALWILRRMGSDSKGSKINPRGCVEQELEMPAAEKGDDWKTIS